MRIIERNRLIIGMVLAGFALSSLPGLAIAQTPTDAVYPDQRNRIDVIKDGGKLNSLRTFTTRVGEGRSISVSLALLGGAVGDPEMEVTPVKSIAGTLTDTCRAKAQWKGYLC